MILWLSLACSDKTHLDTATVDDGITTQNSCFANTPSVPTIVQATPYNEDTSQSTSWTAHFKDGNSQRFEMGRATMGKVHLSSDATWGIVAQENGSAGIFSIADQMVSVIDPEWIPTYDNATLYISKLWLDPAQDKIWFVDGNLYDKGGLYKVDLDCTTKQLGDVQKIFASKNGGPISFIDHHNLDMLFVGKDINGQQLIGFTEDANVLLSGTVFPDDQAIFSAMTTNGTDILISDNNEFSGVGDRVAHLTLTDDGFVEENLFSVENPMAMAFAEHLALIASGFGNAIYLYDSQTKGLSELPLSSTSQLPFSIVEHNESFYIGEYNAIRKVTLDQNGYQSDEIIIQGTGMTGIFGPFGIQGDW